MLMDPEAALRRVRSAALKFALILERASARSEARGHGELRHSWRRTITEDEIEQLYFAAKRIGRLVIMRDAPRPQKR
jgi:hypothetical protein